MKLETMKRRKIQEKKNNGNNWWERRNWGRKFRSKRVDKRRWQWDRQYGWPILQVVEKFFGTRKLKIVLWLGKIAKSIFIFFSILFIYLSIDAWDKSDS